MEISKKVILFENIVLNEPFMRKFALTKKGEIEFYEDGLGHNYCMSFLNEKRCIDIKMCIVSNYNKAGDRISVIINKEDQVDVDDIPYFLLKKWVEYSKDKNDWKLFYLNSYEGSFEEKLKSFFAYLNELFEDENLAKVLRGETWMNFDFDWRGMK